MEDSKHLVDYEEFVNKMFPHPVYGERDFHAVATVQLGELIDGQWFNWKEEDGWVWDYYDLTQKYRLQRKIDNHYFWREIGILPPLHWKTEFLRTLNEIMPKYKYLYDMLADPNFDPFMLWHHWGTRNEDYVRNDKNDRWGKSRDIGSDFPQTMLSGNSDYASTGRDNEYENLADDTRTNDLDIQFNEYKTGDFLEKFLLFSERYKDVDAMIIDELDCLFSHLVSVNINAW